MIPAAPLALSWKTGRKTAAAKPRQPAATQTWNAAAGAAAAKWRHATTGAAAKQGPEAAAFTDLFHGLGHFHILLYQPIDLRHRGA